MAAAAIPALAGAMSTAAPAIAGNAFLASLAGGAATGTLLAPAAAAAIPTAAAAAIPAAAATFAPAVAFQTASSLAPSIAAPASGIFAAPNLAALSGTPAYTGMGMAGAPPTFSQSVMSAGRNIQGLMNENPALTNIAKQAGGAMMQPPPPPQVLQAPPIQSGQFAPVDFMSLLSQKSPQMQRRTSLLG
jgi:hypothetical protein